MQSLDGGHADSWAGVVKGGRRSGLHAELAVGGALEHGMRQFPRDGMQEYSPSTIPGSRGCTSQPSGALRRWREGRHLVRCGALDLVSRCWSRVGRLFVDGSSSGPFSAAALTG